MGPAGERKSLMLSQELFPLPGPEALGRSARAALQVPLSCSYLMSSMAITGWLSSEEVPGPKKQQSVIKTQPEKGKGQGRAGNSNHNGCVVSNSRAHPVLEGGWVPAPESCCAQAWPISEQVLGGQSTLVHVCCFIKAKDNAWWLPWWSSG